MSKTIRQLKEILKEELPTGSAKIIKYRLEKKGHEFSEEYIRRVLNPKNTIRNYHIMNEAYYLCNESLDNLLELQQKQTELQTY